MIDKKKDPKELFEELVTWYDAIYGEIKNLLIEWIRELYGAEED